MKETFDQGVQARSGHWLVEHRDLALRLGVLAIVLAFILAGVVMWLTGRFELKSVGFAGVWLLSFIGAGSIVVPVPGLAAVCLAGTPAIGLNPIAVGVVAGSAEALGELTGYAAGLTGRNLVARYSWYPRIQAWMGRYGGAFLFVMSVIPNPLFDIVGIAAGSIGYPVKRFLAILFVAKSLKGIGIAYTCYYGFSFGLPWLRDLILG